MFPQNIRSFSGVLGNYLHAFPGVLQSPGRKFQNSRSFPGIPGVVGTMKKKMLYAL